jgi:hypothetical protein
MGTSSRVRPAEDVPDVIGWADRKVVSPMAIIAVLLGRRESVAVPLANEDAGGLALSRGSHRHF